VSENGVFLYRALPAECLLQWSAIGQKGGLKLSLFGGQFPELG
jgi:hypothetical protein